MDESWYISVVKHAWAEVVLGWVIFWEVLTESLYLTCREGGGP